ncbi:nucleoporin [Moniliophthora roreri MCA 2997]|uniref:Nucleoporin n=1 Tax=Moniliophthora roreri (strain MCA 2997) TaxID=1381753 RepID=V2XB21_MONRO|nr:nucleoporin [Moniliophthora roreri MCA 2997]
MSAASKQSVAAPLIPEKYLDVPSQRLYYLSVGLFCQAVKALDFLRSFANENAIQLSQKWLFVDFVYCVVLATLRIPRLNYSKAVVALQIISLWFLDGLLFGGIRLNVYGDDRISSLSGPSGSLEWAATPQSSGFLDYVAPFTFGLLSSEQSASSDSHLLGQHTVRMSPISTAQLNAGGHSFCLPSSSDSVLIPVLLNNTNPIHLTYSITPLGHHKQTVERVELSSRDLKAIEQARIEALQVARPSTSNDAEDEYDEYDDDSPSSNDNTHSNLQKTQSLVHIKLSKPAIVRLERVIDASNVEARLVIPSEALVVPCPKAEFVPQMHSADDIYCLGQDPDVELLMDISGVPPLSLRWSRSINGRKETFLVEGIEGSHSEKHPRPYDDDISSTVNVHGKRTRAVAVPEQLRVPLTVSLDSAGAHMYALEEVMDAVGNVVIVPSDARIEKDTKAVQSFRVLQRPAMSFKFCSPGNPTPLLIGQQAQLAVAANEVDLMDAPWSVELKYRPPVDNEKKLKAWKKTISSEGSKRELTIAASAPGEYTLTSVRGKYCNGDILAPESCVVVERPMPTAEIEWKKIHECSGDTGVSASLVLHGTPPFHVYYREQKDSEPARELTKTFGTSRGELTIQPEHSGHYTFTFTQISDANYKKVELKGPTIDQIIHPPASAEFANTDNYAGRKKKEISSCEGNSVDVDVDLRGSGPWNLELQVVGPKNSETIKLSDINSPRKTLQIPIPSHINQEGGSFDIDLVSVEDKYGCKRSLSVPGISVKVRRLKPTVKFYDAKGKRHLTVIENKRASLPLRLTGEGPWRVKYRHVGKDGQRIASASLTTPNDFLHVTESGEYELLEIFDSQCPGNVVTDASTFTVDWVPRPAAKLSSKTQAVYEPFNGSYVLPPICEGKDDHVDLELTGRPPFQIMYNIAQNSDSGGIKLVDQPVFNSIQHRTRIQLLTSNPGRVYYEVKQIGDAAYPLEQHRNTPIPRADRLLFEQQVSMRPSARFRNRNRLSYCLNDNFVPLDRLSSDGVINFEGTPPFQVQLSIKNLAASTVDHTTIEVVGYSWKIELQTYQFESIGPHLVVVESVADASGCPHAALDPLTSSIWVDVSETAAIVPVDRREDYCVGDIAQFQLEGKPPWSIGYRINGKSYTQEAKTSPFSLLQQQPGEFVVTSIAHQQKMCKASITDLRFNVHPLPSAQVGHGKRIYQDIHEGDQAEIVFTLIGEPPFTFTYQRAELATRGKPGKILETHTVSRVFSNEYSIFSALEGTWTVTSISDKYCRYPPTSQDASSDRSRR